MIDNTKASKIAKRIIEFEKSIQESNRDEISSDTMVRSIKKILEDEVNDIEID